MSEAKDGSATLNRFGVSGREPLPWWIFLVVVLGALLMAVGGVIALVRPGMLVSPHDEINGAVRVYAGYLVSRNLALATMLLAMLTLRARGALGNLMVLTAFIQFLDAGIDCMEGRWAVVPGVVIFGLIFFIGAARISVFPFWRRQAWF
jgi:hypothetical protein